MLELRDIGWEKREGGKGGEGRGGGGAGEGKGAERERDRASPEGHLENERL